MKKKNFLLAFLSTIIGAVGGAIAVGSFKGNDVDKCRQMSDKHLSLFLLMNEWMKTKQEGKHIKEYFEKNGYKTVAVYGLSYVGERLLEELKGCDIKIGYAIDKNAASIYSDIDVYEPNDNFPKVDVIIVTAVYFFDEIYNDLVNKVNCPVVSFEDVLYELN